jgi:hypothetical protein
MDINKPKVCNSAPLCIFQGRQIVANLKARQ